MYPSGECKKTTCNLRCNKDQCYGPEDNQCYGSCNDTYNINTELIKNNDFYLSMGCKCIQYTRPLDTYPNVCYYDFLCSRTCNEMCTKRDNDLDCLSSDGKTKICDPKSKCLVSCNPNSYNIKNLPIPNSKKVPYMDCNCESGYIQSEEYAEICILKDILPPDLNPKIYCHPFCNGKCLKRDDHFNCFISCNSNNTLLEPIYNLTVVKPRTYCHCIQGDIYTGSTPETIICPLSGAPCSPNCLHYCETTSDSSKCFFNCKKDPFIIKSTNSNPKKDCGCINDFEESTDGCKC